MLRERPFLRTALLSAVATTVTYAAATAVSWIDPTAAALSVLVAMRTTFHASAQEAFKQVLGTVIATGMAFAAISVIPAAPVAIFVGLLAAYGVVRMLRNQLGDDAAITVAIPLVLVVAAHFSGDQAAERVAGVVLGSVAGMLASWFSRPGLPHERILAKNLVMAGSLSALLVTIADVLAHAKQTVTVELAGEWLTQAESTLRELHELETRALDAVEGASWSPTVEADDAAAVLAQVRITMATAVTVSGICRDLLAAAVDETELPERTAVAVASVLAATAELITEQAETARERPAEALGEDAPQLQDVDQARDKAIARLRELDDTQPLLLGGSLLRDSDKIATVLATGEPNPAQTPDA